MQKINRIIKSLLDVILYGYIHIIACLKQIQILRRNTNTISEENINICIESLLGMVFEGMNPGKCIIFNNLTLYFCK